MGDDAQFVFTGQLTQKQFRAIFRHTGRKGIWFLRILGIPVLLLGLFLLTAFRDITVLILIALGAVIAFLLPVLAVRTSMRLSGRTITMPVNVRIDAEGIHSRTEFLDSVYRWPLIERFDQRPEALLLWVGKARFVPVAVDQLPPETRAALVSFVQAHLPGAASAPLAGESPTVRPPAS